MHVCIHAGLNMHIYATLLNISHDCTFRDIFGLPAYENIVKAELHQKLTRTFCQITGVVSVSKF